MPGTNSTHGADTGREHRIGGVPGDYARAVHGAEVVTLDALALRLAQRGQLRTAQQLLATADDAALAAVNVVDESTASTRTALVS